MTGLGLIVERLRDAGFAAESVTAAPGGVVALAGLVTLADGGRVFAKTLPGPGSELFEIEADGLRALTELGGARTPPVLAVTNNLLVLAEQRAAGAGPDFWAQLGHQWALMHTRTIHDRFGWHRDGWLGRLRQDNTWTADGHEFFAVRRILRWLPEPPVQQALDRADRAAIERLCAALPDLVPAQPPVLNHGDLWLGNVLADADGRPVLIDPAVSYTWAESDLSMFFSSPHPPAAARVFAAYAELAPLHDGWRDRMPLYHLRELLSIIAHGDDDWGAAAVVRRTAAPFARR